ncbi:hypothetical protein GCM10028816_03540 [Spirosoma lituiforme]
MYIISIQNIVKINKKCKFCHINQNWFVDGEKFNFQPNRHPYVADGQLQR